MFMSDIRTWTVGNFVNRADIPAESVFNWEQPTSLSTNLKL
jgi:hypothetical protein